MKRNLKTATIETSWSIYIVECSDKTLYTGSSNDVLKRFKVHCSGKGARYTRPRLPLKLVYTESCENRSSALKREYAVKQLTRAEKIKLISGKNTSAKKASLKSKSAQRPKKRTVVRSAIGK